MFRTNSRVFPPRTTDPVDSATLSPEVTSQSEPDDTLEGEEEDEDILIFDDLPPAGDPDFSPEFGPDDEPGSSVLFANHLLVIVLYSGIVGCLASCILVALCVIGARKCRAKQYGLNEEGSESTASSDLPIIKGSQKGTGVDLFSPKWITCF